jgi:hypothetical protein
MKTKIIDYFINSNGDGHIWVATGVKWSNYCQCTPNESNNLVKTVMNGGVTYFYMDWGHGGSYNDWYFISVLPSNENYSSGQQMIYGIYPD